MQKTSQRELDPRQSPSLNKTEELRNQLLSNDGILEKISFRAYELYQSRGASTGGELDDWLQAEKEVLSPLIEQKLKPSSETSKATTKPMASNVAPAKLPNRKLK